MLNCLKSNVIISSDNLASWPFNSIVGSESLNGFAHGTSGIIPVLCNLINENIEVDTSADLFTKALNFDRTFYDHNKKCFCDGRYWPNEKFDSLVWCHGSPGIALSRLLMLKNNRVSIPVPISEIEDEISEIGEKMYKESLEINGMSLCHGTLSNAEILRAIGYYTNNDLFINKANLYIEEICEQILEDDNLLFGGKNIMNYGLFSGISGIGYQMLRFFNWSKTPSILVLEPSTFKHENPFLH
ncbi:MAG: lanthionine synthetase LanC family protein [Edaphocola sp.]